MSAANPVILLLEDCPVTALLIERMILHRFPTSRLIWARSIAEAKERSVSIPISVFIIDIHLPDGSGLDFLDHAARAHPSACAIIITATPLPEHRAASVSLGALAFIEKPLKTLVLLEQLRRALGSQTPGEPTRDFRATLDNITPMDIIQLKCLSGVSTVVAFRYKSEQGSIRFENGDVVDAQAGTRRGVDAVREIVSWPRGHVFEHAAAGELERTISCPWQTLLMEAAQAIDEHRARMVTA